MENFWEIDGNFWSRDKYSYDEALEASKTLKECKNCQDCTMCQDCYDLMEVSNKGENE